MCEQRGGASAPPLCSHLYSPSPAAAGEGAGGEGSTCYNSCCMTRPAYLISHTHWDREWYRTYQQFRLDLVRTVDLVLDTLETDPAFPHFLLDGQTIVLDDYLAMRPHRAEALRRHIASGRLAVGP